MAIAAIITKVMPDSPSADLEKIKKEIGHSLTKMKALNISYDIQPVAFGLKAIMVKFAWPEEQDTSMIEDALAKLENVSSVRIEDYRRAFG